MPKHARCQKSRIRLLRLPAERRNSFDGGSWSIPIVWLFAVIGLYLSYAVYMPSIDEGADPSLGGEVLAISVTTAGPVDCLVFLLSGPLGDGVEPRRRRIRCDAP